MRIFRKLLNTGDGVVDVKMIFLVFPFFGLGLLAAAGLTGGAVGLGVGLAAGAAVGYYYNRPMYYPYPAMSYASYASYAPYPYSYGAPAFSPGRVCPHCGAAI